MEVNAKDKNFIVELILPLLGLSEEEILFSAKSIETKEMPRVQTQASVDDGIRLLDKNHICADFPKHLENPYSLTVGFENSIDDESLRLFKYLLRSYFEFVKGSDAVYFKNALINEKVNELILQKGLFSYMLNDANFSNRKIDDLFKCLQRWSEKTYEGHNVCYGFLIDPDAPKGAVDKNSCHGDFIDFIGEEYSAVFTDGITSIVEVNKECDFIEYHSVLHGQKPLPNNLEGVMLPIRFAQIIYENVVGNKVGLFLLTNGDVIFAKRREICFVRRGGRWLNFSLKSFYDTIREYLPENGRKKEIIQSIYCSCLDISFSHSGGLLAVVDSQNEKWKEDLAKADNPIVTKLDLLSESDFDDGLDALQRLYEEEKTKIETSEEKESIKKNLDSDLRKRITKKYYLLKILKGNTSFPAVDRKLRADLSGLDGAIILDTNGTIIACGAIIANKSGSSGGGRGSAARTLSKYGGFAIKISTDGYIEAFVNESRIYSIK